MSRNPGYSRRRRRIHMCGPNDAHIDISLQIGTGARVSVSDHVSAGKNGQRKMLQRLRAAIAKAEKLLEKSV